MMDGINWEQVRKSQERQERQNYLTALKETRAIYPGEQIDLDYVTDLESANRVWYFASQGVRSEYLKYFLELENSLKQEGKDTFARIKLMNQALRRAPSTMFRPGFREVVL